MTVRHVEGVQATPRPINIPRPRPRALRTQQVASGPQKLIKATAGKRGADKLVELMIKAKVVEDFDVTDCLKIDEVRHIVFSKKR